MKHRVRPGSIRAWTMDCACRTSAKARRAKAWRPGPWLTARAYTQFGPTSRPWPNGSPGRSPRLSEPRPAADRGGRRLTWPVAAVLTFLATACVLVLEIAAGRLLAPYVGVSLTTYTGIIGAILAGIALGAWIGGRAADAFGPERLMGPSFVLGGAAAIAAVPIVGWL